jgi:hypothetical protein
MQQRAIYLLGCSRAPASVFYTRLFLGGLCQKHFLDLPQL